MKKTLLITAMIATTAINSAHAESRSTEWRRAGVFFGSAIAGAVVAGPIGMLAAAGSGVWLDEQVEKAFEVDTLTTQLAQANKAVEQLHYRLTVAEDSAEQYAASALEPLQLALLFKTGQSELTEFGRQRLALLAEVMARHSGLSLRLDGYADPRGDADYNLALSSQRVAAVATALQQLGIDENRMATYSHGATESVAATGDIDSYALERVVRIQLHNKSQGSVARIDITQ